MTGIDQVIWNFTKDQDLFCIWGIASLEEPLKEDLTKQALKILIKTIPILSSRPVTNWLCGKWQLIEKNNVDDLITRITTQTDEEASQHLNKIFLNPIDAKDVSMIRIFSIDGPMKHYFVIQVHHLVVDGEGLKRICVRFAQIYQELYRNKGWTPAGINDPCRSWWQIARNFTISHSWLILKSYIINMYTMIMSIIHNRKNYKISGDTATHEKADIDAPPYFESITIDQESMRKLKSFSKNKHVTVNDILMTSLSFAIMEWNKKCGDTRNWLKFGYTANLRRWWGEPNGTFGNFSVILIHEETTKNLQDTNTALVTIKSKVDKIKKRIGLDGFFIMMQLKFIPYIIIRKISSGLREKLFEFVRQSHAMTNIGIVFEEAGDFGHTKATGYSLLAPTLAGGCIIYTVTTYKNLTTIYLGSSEDYLTKKSANHFLRLWKQMILKIIGIG